MMKAIDWEGSVDLEKYVFSLFEEKKTESVEFKYLLRTFGREYLKKIFEKYKKTQD